VCANRFLRGMVRLIVGTGLNAGLGKVSLEEIKSAMDSQTILPHAWSVPPEGLYLHEIRY
jgi:tRNA pseudouridine38-40 synthase